MYYNTVENNTNLKNIKQVLKENPNGLTVKETSEKADINRNSAAKYLEILTIAGQVERKEVGPAKLYKLSDNVPLNMMLDYSSDSIIVIDKSLKIVQANENFIEKFDIKKKNILNEKIDHLELPLFKKDIEDDSIPSFPDESIIPEIQSALNENEQRTTEVSLDIESKKSYLEIDMIPTSLYNGDSGLTMIIKDITKRKEAELRCEKYNKRLQEIVEKRTKEIKRNKEMMQTLINAADDSIYMVDEDCRYIIVNDELASRLGTEKEQIIGEKFDKFHTEEETKEFKSKVQEVFEEKKMTKHEHSWDDPERHFLRTLSPVQNPEDNKVEKVAIVSKDITSMLER